MGNSSAVAGINKMGSSKSVNLDTWNMGMGYLRNIWIIATHFPGTLKVEADKEFREQELRTEWMLKK